MILFIFCFFFGAQAAPAQKLSRAGITVPPVENWKVMASLPVFELQDFDLVLQNQKNPTNKRFVTTQFGDTSKMCQGEFESLKKAGFQVVTTAKPSWHCVLKAEKGSDRRFVGIQEIKRWAGKKRPAFVSQVFMVETGAQSFGDYEKWLASVKVIK